MAIKELKDINKRPRYFAGQYLLEDDFESEQDYSRDRLQRYTRSLHVAGIADGLIASKPKDDTLKLIVDISAGTAIDPQGRQIVLIASRQVDLSKNLVETVNDYILSIGYDEEESEPQDATNTNSNQRILENPIFKLSTSSPGEDWIAIAKLTIKDGNVSIPIDSNSVRQYTGLRLPSSSDNPLTLRSGGDRASNLAVLSGSLSVTDQVGIGTTTPTEKLEISGGNLKVSGNISATGNVGIGTTDPKQQLVVNSGKASIGYNDAKQTATFAVNGNVGIGTTDPKQQLVVNSGKASIGYNDAKQTATFAVNGNVGIGTTTPSGFQIVLPESSKGSSPLVSAGVTIAGGASGNASIELRNAGTGTPYIDFAQNATTTDYDARIRLTEPGKLAIEGANVGIGTTSPGAKLQVGDTITNYKNYDFTKTTLLVKSQSPNTKNSDDDDFQTVSEPESVLTLVREGLRGYAWGNMADFRLSRYGNASTEKTSNTQLDIHLTKGEFESSKVMTLRSNGRVGIGTSNPDRGLVEINGTVPYTTSNFGYLNAQKAPGKQSEPAESNYSLYANGNIAAIEFHAVSDSRIKELKGRSNSQADLQTLLKLAIADYTFKDKIAHGDKQYKKVVGQQIAQVYPQAVSTHKDAVPDVFQVASTEGEWVSLPNHGLQVGERVKLIWEGKEATTHTIEAVTLDKFQVSINHSGEVFVYGREVDDFHVVDYEALSMLHISATQEIYKIITGLQAEIQQLKSRINENDRHHSDNVFSIM